MTDIYYFGCENDDAGHFFWRELEGALEDITSKARRESVGMPWEVLSLDGGKLAYGVEEDRFHRWSNRLAQVEGRARLSHEAGWTALSFWDRSVDTRPGSHSTFVASETLSFDEMVALAKERFGFVWARYAFDVVLAETREY